MMKTFLWGLLACVLAGNALAADVKMDSVVLLPRTAPGSPLDGQFWSTTAGFFGHTSGGGTVGPLGAGGGSGTVTSVGGTSTGGTLTPTGGPVTTSGSLNFELNLAHANTWSGQQTFVAPILGTIASGNGAALTGLTLAGHAAQAANTVAANVTSGSAAPTAASLPSCVDSAGNHLNYTNGTGFSCGTSSSGGGGSLTVTDGTHSVTSTTTLTMGSGLLVGGSAGSATLDLTVSNVTKVANFTLTAAEMGGQVNYNGSSITATIPAISSTIFASGMSSTIVNRAASALTVSTTPTINNCGASASLGTYGFMNLVSNGTSLDAICFAGYGTITNGALVKFSGTGGITTAGDLSGDVTTSGSLVATVAKVAGTSPGTNVVAAFGTTLSAAGGLSSTVASGTSAMGTSAISSAACATVVTTSATNTATTDVVSWGFNGDPTAVTGYVPLVAGMLTIIAYPSANNVNFKVCNNTNASVTPGAITLNWRVIR